MPCLFALFAGFAPRLATLFMWIARPFMFNAAFGGSWFWPLLGIIFLPFTTLMYVFLVQGVGGIQGLDWLWLILAVLLDIATVAGAGVANRNRLPGGNPGQTYVVAEEPDKPANPTP